MFEVANSSIRIASTFIPLKGYNILLPNTCIDEVVLTQKIEPIKQAPLWCLGSTIFKQRKILVVSLEALEKPTSQKIEAGNYIIVILKRPPDYEDQIEVGILADKMPHVVQADNFSLDFEYSPSSNHKLALSYIKIKEKQAFIPDINRLFREYISNNF